MQVFLTGGTGTIGRAVLALLLERGHSVKALARSPESGARLRAAGAQAVSGDLRDPRGWLEEAARCDTLVHTAATFDAQAVVVERRLVAALKALPADRPHPFSVVYTGGIWLYPASPVIPLRENTPFHPLPAFAHVANAIRSLLPIRHLALSVIHPALVCGRDGGPIADMRCAAETGHAFQTRAGLETLWPLVSDEDLADLYVRAIEARRYRLSLVGCGVDAVPVSTLMRLVSDGIGLRLDLEHAETPAHISAELDIAAGYALSQRASSDGAAKLLGWVPRQTTPEDLVKAHTPVAG
ncbi:NAD-dependent epimerase/dehydratase family protein [Stappia sp. ES.058]|uniref:NAD-dependent epimerase/dehydratase family protein n=1 Tax=Stappia sp. ES.058 TaxID=1881061 RepID=UPI00087B0EE7|nr:NAD-dependent epimerase/dehydratase family protein [Stappia sp. ES.058]SDU20084.1 Nucleoside-diphosphate-sugar epimerase [Stappia sp. ES.058]